VPVEASVAAILRAIWPDLPMPVTMTRPVAWPSASTAMAKGPSSDAIRALSPSISREIVRFAEVR
jgi:hypothetical protein